MSYQRVNLTFVLMLLVVFLGCAAPPQKEINLISENISSSSGKVGIITTPIPKAIMTFPGAECLLCYGVAMASHSSFRNYAETLEIRDLKDFNHALVSRLNSKGIVAINLGNTLDLKALEMNKDQKEGYSKIDFRKFQQEDITSLIVVNYKELGFKRGYMNYIPTETPQANMVAEAYMVRLGDNKLIWYTLIKINRGVVGEWDVPPKYSELTSAYYSAIEEFKGKIKDAFN